MDQRITIVAHADNRPTDSRNKGKREPLVQVLLSAYGEVSSVSFNPAKAPEIAEAILKAGRAAKRGRISKTEFLLGNN